MKKRLSEEQTVAKLRGIATAEKPGVQEAHSAAGSSSGRGRRLRLKGDDKKDSGRPSRTRSAQPQRPSHGPRGAQVARQLSFVSYRRTRWSVQCQQRARTVRAHKRSLKSESLYVAVGLTLGASQETMPGTCRAPILLGNYAHRCSSGIDKTCTLL